MNIRFLVVFSLLFAMLLPSVAFPSETVVVMIDLSDSTESQRDDYHKYFDDFLATIESGDKLLLMQIALAPTGGSVIALHQEYPEFSLFENRDRQLLRQRQLSATTVKGRGRASIRRNSSNNSERDTHPGHTLTD